MPHDKPVKRVVFHEITPDAVRAAMEHPREIDMDLVDAQQARRVLDRLVGYTVSPLLWKKVKRGLSAGRVQTAALRIVVDREREIEAFVAGRVLVARCLTCTPDGGRKQTPTFKAGAASDRHGEGRPQNWRPDERSRAGPRRRRPIAWHRSRSARAQRRPSAPFTTSTLQQEASRKLGYTVRRTMQLAQELYEGVDLGRRASRV